ncbi:MAG: phage tail protein [Methanomicrobia archaeon]|nr:phage tail protein [Methanomicrobia archaeon]
MLLCQDNQYRWCYHICDASSITGAVSLALSPVGEAVKFYADNIEYFKAYGLDKGYDGTFELAIVPDAFQKDIMGMTEDSKKVLFELQTPTPAPFALLFQFEGDANATRHALYNCLATRINIESSTKTPTLEPKTDTISIEARPAVDTSYIKASTKSDTDETVYNNWFTAVQAFVAGG